LHPHRHDVAVVLETTKPLGVLEELLDEVLDRVLHPLLQTARVAVVGEAREEGRQHAVHLELLKIEIRNLREPELAVALRQGHHTTSVETRSMSRRPSPCRRILKKSCP